MMKHISFLNRIIGMRIFIQVEFSLTNIQSRLPQHESGLNKRSSLQIIHRQSPCSRSWQGRGQVVGTKTPNQSLKQILLQDQIRVHSLHYRLSNKPNQILRKQKTTLPALSGLSIGTGNYVVRVGLGTPNKEYSVLFDTGSDLTWVQCLPCVGFCHKQQDPLFNPSNSSSYSNITCDSDSCAQIFNATGDPARCYWSTCGYGIQYGDRSFSAGFLASETLTLNTDIIPKFLFGCGQNNDGLFGSSDGLLGLGHGKLALPFQTANKYGQVFSYCLPSTSSSTGYLTLGDEGVSSSSKFTPLLTDSRGPPLYFLDLIGVSVGGVKLDIPASVFKSSGAIIDSGTVISRLPESAYSVFRSAFRKLMSRYRLGKAFSILDTCYNLTGYKEVRVPKIALFFEGDVEVELDSSGILIPGNTTSQMCLAFAGTSDAEEFAIFGNWQQKKLDVIYDLARKRVGFGPGSCS